MVTALNLQATIKIFQLLYFFVNIDVLIGKWIVARCWIGAKPLIECIASKEKAD